jgi:nucleoside-diphosphate-sugar epimerase
MENKINSVTVIGAGHLGHPLSNHLVSLGYKVIGTNTKESNPEALYQTKILSLDKLLKEDVESIDSEVFIVNIPPSKTSKDDLTRLRSSFKNKKFIFISSTSVFNDNQEEVSEETTPLPESERSKNVFSQEEIFKEDCRIRCSGLISESRHPVNSLIHKENIGSNHPLNLIHIDDVINIISIVLKENHFTKLIHATHLNSYTKGEYYSKISEQKSLGKIKYKESSLKGKKVLSKTLKEWKYKFVHNLFKYN